MVGMCRGRRPLQVERRREGEAGRVLQRMPHFLASTLCRTMQVPVDKDLPKDWRAMQTLLFEDRHPDLATAIHRT
jgi:hypothetical protein